MSNIGNSQFFPDQDSYGVKDPGLSHFDNVVEEGVEWIQMQGQIAQT